jgi:hypothetical protein
MTPLRLITIAVTAFQLCQQPTLESAPLPRYNKPRNQATTIHHKKGE